MFKLILKTVMLTYLTHTNNSFNADSPAIDHQQRLEECRLYCIHRAYTLYNTCLIPESVASEVAQLSLDSEALITRCSTSFSTYTLATVDPIVRKKLKEDPQTIFNNCQLWKTITVLKNDKGLQAVNHELHELAENHPAIKRDEDWKRTVEFLKMIKEIKRTPPEPVTMHKKNE